MAVKLRYIQPNLMFLLSTNNIKESLESCSQIFVFYEKIPPKKKQSATENLFSFSTFFFSFVETCCFCHIYILYNIITCIILSFNSGIGYIIKDNYLVTTYAQKQKILFSLINSFSHFVSSWVIIPSKLKNIIFSWHQPLSLYSCIKTASKGT